MGDKTDFLDLTLREIIDLLDTTQNKKFKKFNEKMIELFTEDLVELEEKPIFELYVQHMKSFFDLSDNNFKKFNLLDNLSSYDKYSRSGRIPKENRDWVTIKTPSQLKEIISEIDEKVEVERLEKLCDKHFEDDKWLILEPLCYESSRRYGRNTQWCTTESESSFEEYGTGSRGLIYVINKKTDYKVAVCFDKNNLDDSDFYDPEDETHDLFYFVRNNLLDGLAIEKINSFMKEISEKYVPELEETTEKKTVTYDFDDDDFDYGYSGYANKRIYQTYGSHIHSDMKRIDEDVNVSKSLNEYLKRTGFNKIAPFKSRRF